MIFRLFHRVNHEAGPSTRLSRGLLLFVALLAQFNLSLPAAAATFSVTQASCQANPGGYQWAIEQANATPGRDTISIDVPLFNVDDCDHPDPLPLPIAITESVDIVGHGHTVNGNVAWINSSGVINEQGICPPESAIWATAGGSLVDVGVRRTDNSGIDVTISDLKMTGLVTVGYVRQNATLTIEGSDLNKILSLALDCNQSLISAERGADLTLRHTRIESGSVPASAFGSSDFPLAIGLIDGNDGDLVMDDVDFESSQGEYANAVLWGPGTVKIVNSRFWDSGGLMLTGTQAQFVNSTYQVGAFLARFTDNIILLDNAVLRAEASTFYWGSPSCSNCLVTRGSGADATKGLGFVGYRDSTGLPTVSLDSTAIGSLDFDLLQHFWGDPRVFTSDAYTWVQPTSGQNATELAAILPNASTATPGLTTQISVSELGKLTPIVPGILIEAVPDAGIGGVNVLLNPIDGLPLTTDVWGSPRVYANGTRNIGAVQNIDAPTLGASTGDSKVTLKWSPTPQGQALGYEICTSATPLTDPWAGACPGTISNAGASETTQTITGLTNGTPYYFVIRVLAGIWSNVAAATPMGPIGIAQPSGVTVRDGSLQVFWNAPSAGGHPGPLSYSVFYRPVGTQTWLLGPQSLAGQTTLLPDLVNGTVYEIGVLARGADGAYSPTLGTDPTVGVGRGTPQAAPTLSFATPATWTQNTPLTLVPTVTQLQGSGTYSIVSGALPAGMNLAPNTGIISGTPTTQQSTSATIRLTDGTTGLFTEAAVPLSIVTPSNDPQLWYPTIQTTVGVGPINATPTQANIPAGATFSVVSAEPLPNGFYIDANSGVISGTATTVPGRVLSVDIQACWGGCDPNAGEVRIAPMLFWIVPRLQYPANTLAIAGGAVTITPTVDLWSGGQFSIASGNLPDGLTLDPVTGVISGTPHQVVTSPITLRYSTGVNVTVPPLEYVYANTQVSVASPTITMTYPTVTATAGKPLSVSPTVTGLTGTPFYSLVSGSLPQGLILNPSTGVISGVPGNGNGTGSYPVVIQVADLYGSQRTSVVFELTSPPAPPPAPIPVISTPALTLLLVFLLALMARRSLQISPREGR